MISATPSFDVLVEGTAEEINAHEAAIFLRSGVTVPADATTTPEDAAALSGQPTLIFTSQPYECATKSKSPLPSAPKAEDATTSDVPFFVDIKALVVDGPHKGRLVVLHTSRNLANGGTVGCDGRLLFCFQGAKLADSEMSHLGQIRDDPDDDHHVLTTKTTPTESGDTNDDDDDDALAYLPAGVFSVSPRDWSDWRREFEFAWGQADARFNSPNDVVVSRETGSIWFTDPAYAYLQGYAPEAMLGDWVWRFDPHKRNLAVVADGLSKPNGLAFSPDESVLYVTDTGYVTGRADTPYDRTQPRSVYAYDVLDGSRLANRRLLYVADRGVPDGIKVDAAGNLYTGCLDGVHVVAPDGCLLGKILVDGGAANLCFGRGPTFESRLYILSEDAVVAVDLFDGVLGAPVGVETENPPTAAERDAASGTKAQHPQLHKH